MKKQSGCGRTLCSVVERKMKKPNLEVHCGYDIVR